MSCEIEMTGSSGVRGGNSGLFSGATLLRLMIVCASMAATGTAYAQTAGGNAAAKDELTEVVVTGSRLLKNGNDSPTPVTVLSVEDAEAVHPSTVADQLNDMPQFFGSSNQASNAGAGSAQGGNPNPNANVLNLRNFGVNRTLILSDGHRAASTSPNSTVDVDMIPQLLLQRVEVVTGGASAVYGADAVTGVVNFVTDTKFNGIKVNGQFGQSVYHDDTSKALGVAWGSDLFNGRGHLEASFEYRGDAGVARRSSRPFFQNRYVLHNISLGTANPQLYQLDANVTHRDKAFGGLIVGGPLANQYFASNGVLAPFDFGTRIGTTNFDVGGSGSYFDAGMKAALKMQQLFGRFDYDITDNLHGYVKGSGTQNYNGNYSLVQPFFNSGDGSNNMNLFANNPYLPAQYQAALAAGGATRFVDAKTQQDVPRQFAETFEKQYSVDMGLQGKFGNGYRWELALIRSVNTQKVVQDYTEDGLRLAAALDAVTVTAANVGTSGASIGSIVCNVTLTNPGLYPGCVPYNPFGPNSATDANINYIFTPQWVTAHTSVTDMEGSVAGAPFNTWAGPVNMALSAEWRDLSYYLDSTTKIFNQNDRVDCTGLRIITCGPTSQRWFQGASAPASKVTSTVKEAAVEFDLPLLKDKFLARNVSVNGGMRYTNYSTSGSANTWKAGLEWRFSDSTTLRATRSRDIRAPTLYEMFQPQTVGQFNGTDLLTGVNLNGTSVASDGKTYPTASTFSQGNPNLKPEIGRSTTAGIVFRPTWAPGLSVALDSFFIDVSGAIASVNGNSVSAQSGCTQSGGTSPLCALIVRPISCCSTAPANSATSFYQVSLNVASQWTQGADLEINYAGRVAGRPYSLRLLESYQPHLVTNNTLSGTVDNGGSYPGGPATRGQLVASLSVTPDLRIGLQERWRKSMHIVPAQSAPLAQLVALAPDISPVFYTNLNVGYTIRRPGFGDAEIYANIQNLFNREPPIARSYNDTQPGNFGNAPGDDFIGRYYTLGFRFRR
jgi:outer membrane receptor protein involved in Fe transport